MNIHRRRLREARLYIVLDTQVQGYAQLFKILKESVRAGTVVVQLRDKIGSSREMLSFAEKIVGYLKSSVPFIMNDRMDLALAAQTQGVHLGQDDCPVEYARRILGEKALVGISCQTLAQARQAQKAGADYIGFGSVFRTLTKPERNPMDLGLLEKVTKECSIPVFAIGGINLDNLSQLTDRGIHRVAVTRAVCLSDSVARTTKLFLERLNSVRISDHSVS